MNINKIILMGRLTADPELKTSQSGINSTRFTIAVNRKQKDQNADFFTCVAFRNSAEFITKYFKKGSSIIVFGSVQFEEWTDRDGNKRTSTNVIVDEVQFGSAKTTESSETSFLNNHASDFEEIGDDPALPF